MLALRGLALACPKRMLSPATQPRRQLTRRPKWARGLEAAIGERLRLHPNWLSLAKLFVLTPLFLALFVIEAPLPWVLGVFAIFAALDYLDGVVARHHSLETFWGRILDRVTDYPLVILVTVLGVGVLPTAILMVKLVVDLLLSVQFLLGLGTTENRLRTALHYATLLCVLLIALGGPVPPLTPALVESLLWLNIAFSSLVALYNANIFKKRFIADLLSLANLGCGALSIYFSSQGQYAASLLLLLVGAGFDGLDGAAARRWGGTRFGVYSDDIADAVNYGLAPGLAVYFALGGVTGALIAVAFFTFTVTRLVYFTLAKASSDPRYFQGAPSTVGGIITLSSLTLFATQPALVGLLVGAACIFMVSFDARYRHIGHFATAQLHWIKRATPVVLILLLLGHVALGPELPVAVLLAASLGYSLLPLQRAFQRLPT